MPQEISSRESAILNEVLQLGQNGITNAPGSQQTEEQPTTPQGSTVAMGANVSGQAPSRTENILREVSELAKVDRGQLILNEVSEISARRSQPIISGTSFLEKALDVLNTPQQVMFGMVTREHGESLGQAAVRGMRENTRFQDVLEREFQANPGEIETKIIGFAGDVFLDPMLLFGGPLIKGAAKGL